MQGKLSFYELEKTVLSAVSSRRKEVIKSGASSEDCAVLNLGEALLLASVDPITGATQNLGALSVQVSANDVAACGGEPVAALITLLAPPDAALSEIRKVMEEAEMAAKSINLQIVGGHTEYTDAVNRIVTVTTVIGKANKVFYSSDFRVGDTLIVTGDVATEGTGILVSEYKDSLSDILSQEEIAEGAALCMNISVVKEGSLASQLPIHAMHDVTEGGILGAIYETCRAAGLGAEVNLNQIPVSDITGKLSEYFGIDPYTLISSGSMLIMTSEPEAVISAFSEAGLKATAIGVITEDEQVFAVKNGFRMQINDSKDSLSDARRMIEEKK